MVPNKLDGKDFAFAVDGKTHAFQTEENFTAILTVDLLRLTLLTEVTSQTFTVSDNPLTVSFTVIVK